MLQQKTTHIVEVSCGLMLKKNFPHYYWTKAVSNAIIILNKAFTIVVHDAALKEKLTTRKPNLAYSFTFQMSCVEYWTQRLKLVYEWAIPLRKRNILL